MFDLDPAAGDVHGAPKELGRVIVNLVTNALDAGAEGPTSPGTGASPRAACGRPDPSRRGSVEIAVEDNGPGIPEEVRARLFEPFFTTKPTGAGNVGLGLSLSRDIVVRGHGGTLEVESEEGRGTVFTTTLPVHSG